MDEIAVPEVGTKFKVNNRRGLYSFLRGGSGESSWWFISVNDGKYHAFSPDEVHEAGKKIPRKNKGNATTKIKVPVHLRIEADRKPKTYDMGGEEVIIT